MKSRRYIMNSTLEKLEQFGIVPVVVLDDAKDAAPLAKALCDGGLACAEVTFRTECCCRIYPHHDVRSTQTWLVGAGTVLTIEQVDEAVAAGAKFIVSPGLNPEIVKYCLEKNIAVTPGVVTPSEMAQAVELGLPLVKFFPAEPSGGLPMIHAVAAAYTTLKFMPTGGINPSNVRDYLKDDKIFACGGSWMVKGNLVDAGDFDKIKELTKEAADIVKEIRG